MQDEIRRYLRIPIGATAALVSGALVVSAFSGGAVHGLTRASWILGELHHQASQSSQFWFIIVFWLAVCIGFIWVAWSAWRG